MDAPLERIRIVEVDSWMASPSAAAIFSDMGADVIKVEPPKGDPMRGTGRPAKLENMAQARFDYQFDVDNRGKRSICIDLMQDEGVNLLHQLVRTADIFMCNLLPRRQRKFRLDPQTLMQQNPKLVHATLTGYGTEGPEAERPGFDVTAFFGRSGLYDAMREGDAGVVPQARPGQGDHTTGLAFAVAILSALRLAENTNQGQVVSTSLYETAVWTQAPDFATTVVDHAPVRRRARNQLLTPTANRYPCGDGKWIVINMPEASAWAPFCRALGQLDWLEHKDYADGRGRYEHMPELVPKIDAVLAEKSRDAWGQIFDQHKIIWAPVMSLDEVPKDPQAQAIGLFPPMHHPDIGDYNTVRAPMQIEGTRFEPRGAAPRLGEHNVEVLKEVAGLKEAEIEALMAAQVVGEAVGAT